MSDPLAKAQLDRLNDYDLELLERAFVDDDPVCYLVREVRLLRRQMKNFKTDFKSALTKTIKEHISDV